jgi:hypothetical protein
MKINILMLICISAIAVSCSKGTGSITGNVYWKYNDYVGNKPDAGTEVRLFSTSDTSFHQKTECDIKGDFKFDNVPVGDYILVFDSENTNDRASSYITDLTLFRNQLEQINCGFKDTLAFKNVADSYLQASSLATNLHGKDFLDAYEKRDEDRMRLDSIASKLLDSYTKETMSRLGYTNSVLPAKRKFKSIKVEKDKTSTVVIDFGITYMKL